MTAPAIPHQREALRRYVDTLGPRETWDAGTEQAVAYLEERLAAVLLPPDDRDQQSPGRHADTTGGDQ